MIHPPPCSRASEVVSLPTSHVMECWRRESHSTLLSSFTAAPVLPFWTSYGLDFRMRNSHSFLVVTPQKLQKTALLTRRFTLLLRCSTADLEVWSERCGKWQIRTGKTWRRASTSHYSLARRRVCPTMNDLQERCEMRHRG